MRKNNSSITLRRSKQSQKNKAGGKNQQQRYLERMATQAEESAQKYAQVFNAWLPSIFQFEDTIYGYMIHDLFEKTNEGEAGAALERWQTVFGDEADAYLQNALFSQPLLWRAALRRQQYDADFLQTLVESVAMLAMEGEGDAEERFRDPEMDEDEEMQPRSIVEIAYEDSQQVHTDDLRFQLLWDLTRFQTACDAEFIERVVDGEVYDMRAAAVSHTSAGPNATDPIEGEALAEELFAGPVLRKYETNLARYQDFCAAPNMQILEGVAAASAPHSDAKVNALISQMTGTNYVYQDSAATLTALPYPQTPQLLLWCAAHRTARHPELVKVLAESAQNIAFGTVKWMDRLCTPMHMVTMQLDIDMVPPEALLLHLLAQCEVVSDKVRAAASAGTAHGLAAIRSAQNAETTAGELVALANSIDPVHQLWPTLVLALFQRAATFADEGTEEGNAAAAQIYTALLSHESDDVVRTVFLLWAAPASDAMRMSGASMAHELVSLGFWWSSRTVHGTGHDVARDADFAAPSDKSARLLAQVATDFFLSDATRLARLEGLMVWQPVLSVFSPASAQRMWQDNVAQFFAALSDTQIASLLEMTKESKDSKVKHPVTGKAAGKELRKYANNEQKARAKAAKKK